MNVNIRKLLRETGEPLAGSHDFDFSQSDFGDIRLAAPLHFTYTASPQQGRVLLELSIQAEIVADCARCLAPVQETLDIERTYEIHEADLEDEFPELPLQDGMLDLQELAYGEVVMEAPGVLLCSDDCPGLCAKCGKRADTCECKQEPTGDPRLAVLRQLLDDADE